VNTSERAIASPPAPPTLLACGKSSGKRRPSERDGGAQRLLRGVPSRCSLARALGWFHWALARWHGPYSAWWFGRVVRSHLSREASTTRRRALVSAGSGLVLGDGPIDSKVHSGRLRVVRPPNIIIREGEPAGPSPWRGVAGGEPRSGGRLARRLSLEALVLLKVFAREAAQRAGRGLRPVRARGHHIALERRPLSYAEGRRHGLGGACTSLTERRRQTLGVQACRCFVEPLLGS